jgi:hypothetical protein
MVLELCRAQVDPGTLLPLSPRRAQRWRAQMRRSSSGTTSWTCSGSGPPAS